MNYYTFIIIAVFISGLMVGRTPEFLGKKVEAREMKIATIVALLHPFVILVFTAISSYIYVHHPDFVESEGGWLNNPGYHGLSEQLYEYTSCAANNGSGFEGLGDNYLFLELDMWYRFKFVSRFLPIIGQVAIAGLLAQKKFHTGKCRYVEDGYIDFRSNDICSYLHYCRSVILPGTCIEHDC